MIRPLSYFTVNIVIELPVLVSTLYIVTVLSPALEQSRCFPVLSNIILAAALLVLWSRLTVNIFCTSSKRFLSEFLSYEYTLI